jgi:hypothetical protein
MTEEDATLDEQIAEIARELAMRERLYPTWVATRRMKVHDATRQLRRMRAVLRTLERLRDAERHGLGL